MPAALAFSKLALLILPCQALISIPFIFEDVVTVVVITGVAVVPDNFELIQV